MSFESQVKDALKEMIPKPNDDYTEIQYSDTLYVHIWSSPTGEGVFEVNVIVPYTHENGEFDFDANQLGDIPNTDELYRTLKQVTEEVTGESYPNFAFYLTDQVTGGVWEQDANVYTTMDLEA